MKRGKILILLIVFLVIATVVLSRVWLVQKAQVRPTRTLTKTPEPEEIGWPTLVKVSNTSSDSYEPILVIDSMGVLHLIWRESRPKGDEWGMNIFSLFYTTRKNDVWSEPLRIRGESEDLRYFDMVIDGRDTLHLIWDEERISRTPGALEYGFVWQKLFYSQKPKDGDWSQPELIISSESSDIKEIWDPTLAVDGQGIPHIIFDSTYKTAHNQLFYITRDNNGRWSEPELIAAHPIQLHGPHLAVDSKDTLHLIFKEFELQRAMYATRQKGGNWSAPIELFKFQDKDSSVAKIVFDNQDTLHLVTEEVIKIRPGGTWEIFYAIKSKEGSLSEFTSLTKSFSPLPSQNPSLVADKVGNLHLVWPQYTLTNGTVENYLNDEPYSGKSHIMYITKPIDSEWSKPEIVASSNYRLGEFEVVGDSSIVVGKEQIHVAWVGSVWKAQAKPPDSYLVGDWEIMYSSKSLEQS